MGLFAQAPLVLGLCRCINMTETRSEQPPACTNAQMLLLCTQQSHRSVLQVAGDHKYLHADSTSDMAQMVRHLSDVLPSVPSWKHQRPSLMLHEASFMPSDQVRQQQTRTGRVAWR